MRSPRWLLAAALLGLALMAGLPNGSGESAAAPHRAVSRLAPLTFARIFIVTLENTDYEAALAQPYLKALAARGALLTSFYAVARPSQPNYFAQIAGAPLVRDNGLHNLSESNLVDLLEAAGIAWKTYQEDYPGNCFAGAGYRNLYARKHNPFISFDSIRTDPARCGKIVDAREVDADIAAEALPAYSYYTPNLLNDGHDTGVAYAATWLEQFLEPKLAEPAFADGTLVVVTFDEASGASRDNHIYTALVGPVVRAGTVDPTHYTHYSLLRTIEDNFDLGSLGRNDQDAAPFAQVNFLGE